MNKYWLLIKITLQEYLVYRLNFILWRFRSFILFLTLIFFWLAIFGNQSQILGYSKNQMLTYIIGISLLKSIVLGTRTGDLAGQIKNGDMTKVIARPINFFGFWFAKDLTDKILNILFSVAEISIAVELLKIPLFLPPSIDLIILFVMAILISIFLFFFISMLLSITVFWTEDVWATRWLFGVIFLEFFSGAMFPIDVLPIWLAKIIYFTPFPYLIFLPMKIWLNQTTEIMAIQNIAIGFLWLIVFYLLAIKLFKIGAKNYGAYGG